MRPSYVFGWASPRFAVWTVAMERVISPPFDPLSVLFIIFLGIARWLGWLLPRYTEDERGESYRLLAFHLNIIRGPYRCMYCGRATAQGPDSKYNLPAYCPRRSCLIQASEVFAKKELRP